MRVEVVGCRSLRRVCVCRSVSLCGVAEGVEKVEEVEDGVNPLLAVGGVVGLRCCSARWAVWPNSWVGRRWGGEARCSEGGRKRGSAVFSSVLVDVISELLLVGVVVVVRVGVVVEMDVCVRVDDEKGGQRGGICPMSLIAS